MANLLEQKIAQLRAAQKKLPSKAGIYKMLGAGGEVLYIGKAKNLNNRVRSYTELSRLSRRLQQMVAHFEKLEFIQTKTEVEALLLEQNLIKKYKPRYNVLLKDDKSFAFIELSHHPFPAIKKFRGKQKKGARYFGPFTSAQTLHKMLFALQKIFKIRSCEESYFNARKRPCLLHQLDQCTAPCVGKVTRQAYAEQVKDLITFLSSKGGDVQKKFEREMEKASREEAFEKAAYYRDRLKGIQMLRAQQGIYIDGLGDADFVALYLGEKIAIEVSFFRGSMHYGSEIFFPVHAKEVEPHEILEAFLNQFYLKCSPPSKIYLSHPLMDFKMPGVFITVPQRGVKKELIARSIERIKNHLARDKVRNLHMSELFDRIKFIFELEARPKRIEIYDNSHLFGSFAYGGMVVANEEGFIKKAYRRFKFAKNSPEAGDDYAMMRSVFQRRFKEGKDLPELIIIDGGKGQLKVAYETLKALGIAQQIHLIAMAKGEERNAGKETYYQIDKKPLLFEKKDPLAYYFQILRDEAHRFVIGTHRAGRKKAIKHSILDALPAIGSARKKNLIRHFGSAKAVREASMEELAQVPGISQKLARQIYEAFALS